MPNCAASCRAACLARCGSGLSLGPWTPYLWPVSLVLGLPIDPSSPLARVPVPPSFSSGLVSVTSWSSPLLLLALGCRVEQLLHHEDLVAIDVLAVVAAHARHEEGEDRDEPHVQEERETGVEERRRLHGGEEADRERACRR